MKILLIIISLTLAFGIAFFSYFKNVNSPDAGSANISPQVSPVSETPDFVNGRYKSFSEMSLEENRNSRRVLYFYANWCPTCKPVNEEFRVNSVRIPEGVVIIRVNYNDTETDSGEKELAQKYAITYQHTFVELDYDGNVLQKWNGGGLDELIKNLQ